MTTIEWTERTWNPTVGCSRISPGCDRCYAIGVAHRAMQPAHKGLTVLTDEGADWTGEVRCLPERLDIPLRRKKPTMWFVDSMSDLFHPEVPDEFILAVFTTMARTERHTFQVLTKRPQRMRDLVDRMCWTGCSYPTGSILDDPDMSKASAYLADDEGEEGLPNVWLGTSIESDRYAFRADHLRATPAAVRFLSLEPLLGPLPSLDLTGIDWVIVGGESGPGARPMHPDWARDIRDRCVAADVPFLFKQWGDWAPAPWKVARDDEHLGATHAVLSTAPPVPHELGHRPWSLDRADEAPPQWAGIRRVGKKLAGRELDGRTWDEYPTAERTPA